MLKEGQDFKFNPNRTITIYLNGEEQVISLNDRGYKIISTIDSGANGVTFKAIQVVTKRNVAIKIWKPRSNNMKKYHEQFYAEVQKIAGLKHKNIVTIHDGFILNGGLCVAVYDYVDGMALDKWLIVSNPSLDEKFRICKEILNAIQYYQTEGIIHGDLHSGNVLITQSGEVSLIDFGTSLWAKRGQSSERECFFIFNLIKTLFKDLEAYDEGHFGFEVAGHAKLAGKNNPLFDFELLPKLMTETMLAYTEILVLLTHVNSLERDDLRQLCIYASKSRYLDINSFMSDLMNRYISEEDRPMFMDAMDLNIGEEIFSSYIEDFTFLDQAYWASGIAYYAMAQKEYPELVNPIRFEGESTLHREIRSEQYRLLACEIDRCIKSKPPIEYFSAMKSIQLQPDLDYWELHEKIREILFYSLREHFSEPFQFPYWINTKIFEILADSSMVEIINEEILEYNHR